jgi:putative transposase
LVDVKQRRSYPLRVEQRLPVKAVEKVAPAPKRGRGRPKGSQNHAKAAPLLTPELTLLARRVRTPLQIILPLHLRPIVLDGFFGRYPATGMVRDTGLDLLSKLRHHAALYLPYTGAKPRRGPTPGYGDKLDYQQLPATALVHPATDGDVVTET